MRRLLLIGLVIVLAAPAAAMAARPNPADELDAAGEEQALARRMGVEELIWDCEYWGAGMEDFIPYRPCYDKRGHELAKVDKTVAHRDHVHLGMTKAGAAARTSFWRRHTD